MSRIYMIGGWEVNIIFVAVTHRIFSSRISTSLPSIKLSTRANNSVAFVPSSSSWSLTLSLRLEWFREDRHDSPKMRPAATANRKPSAMALAPFKFLIALEDEDVNCSKLVRIENWKVWERRNRTAHLASGKGRHGICWGSSPDMSIRNFTYERYMNWARSHAKLQKCSCLSGAS